MYVKMKKLILVGICILFLLGLSMVTYSATLILQDADSENTDDAMVQEQDADGTHGTTIYMNIWGDSVGGNIRRAYVRFNLSSIESYQMNQIVDATLQLTVNIGTMDFATNATIVYSNVTWNEETLTWNNQPCGANLDNVGACNISAFINNSNTGETSVKFNVTDFVNNSLRYNEKNISFMIKHYNELVDESEAISTKEDPDSVQRPILNITYTSNYPFISNIVTNSPQGYGYNISINATTISDDGIENVTLQITFPNMTSINYTMNNLGSDIYNYELDDTWQNGIHNFTIFANNSLGYISSSSLSNFNITAIGVVSIQTIDSIYNLTQLVNLTDPPLIQSIKDLVNKLFNKPLKTNYKTYIIEFNEPSQFNYETTVDDKVNESIFIKPLRWIFGEEIDETYKKNLIKNHNEKILDNQNKILKKLNKKPIARYKYTMNGMAVNLSEEEYNEIKDDKNIKKIREESYYNLTISDTIPAMRANQVWAKQNASGDNITGKGITVAVLDSGIDYTHPFFGSCSLTNLTNGTCDRISYGYDFFNDNNDPFDDHGHGTHISGIIGGNGVYKGVAPNVTFLEYKVCSSGGSCPESAIISGIENATLRGVDIISISLGGAYYVDEEPLATSLRSAWDSGILIVASAGNEGDDYLQADDTIACPSCLDFVISVGAFKEDTNVLAGFSSRGYGWDSNLTPQSLKPDVVASGWFVDSSVPTGSCTLCDASGLKKLSGTSMSAPHVSGLLALMKQAHPDWTKEELKSSIVNTAVDIGYNVREQGAGRIDALNAYNATIVISPTNHLFINDNNSILVYNNSYVFNITSKVNYNTSYNISFVGNDNITTIFNTTSINLSGYNSTSVMFNVSINNSISNFSFYNGKIVIGSSTSTFNIPISIYTVLNSVGCPTVGTIYETSTELSGGTCYMPDIIGGNKLEINTSDVELDCNNTLFDYIYQRRGGYGIFVEDLAKNVTITNCNLDYVSVGIYAINSENLTIENSRFRYSEDFMLVGGKRANITNNEFIETTANGIQVQGNYSSITYNLFNSSGYGIRLPGNEDLTVAHIDIKYNNFYITHFTIDAYGVQDINISYNNFTNSFAVGWIFSSADIYIENNRIIYDPNYPCGLVQGQDRCEIFGITGITSWAFEGIPYPVTNRVTSRRNFINVTKRAISHITANNTVHEDNIMSAQTEEIYLSGTDTTFINTTYNISSVTFVGDSSITMEWWAELNVTNSTGNAISNANVSSYINNSGVWELVATKTTDSSGYTKIAVKQYVHNSSGITYYNSKIEVNKTGLFGNSSTFINLSNNLNINITLLGGAPITPVISVVSPTNNSIITDTWLMVNITIDTASSNATYSLNGTTNVSMNKQDTTHFYKNITGLADNSTYNITFYANSTTGVWGVSSTYYFTINTSYTVPSVTKSMINNTGNQDFRGYLTLKVQRDTAGVWGNYKIVTDNQLINLSTTAPYALDTRWFADGAYIANSTGQFRVLVELKDKNENVLTFDNGNYINSSYEFNVTDAGLPVVTIVTPTDNSYIKINYSILNYTFTDDYNTSLNCYYILDSNETASPNNPITNNTYDDINMSRLNESTHTVYVKCDDGTQNGTSSTKTFTTDFTLPNITNPIPINRSTILGTSNEEFTMSPSDTFLDVDTCRLYWKYPESETYTKVVMNFISNNCTIDVDLSEIVDVEIVYYYFEVNDTATNIGVLGTSLAPMTATTSSDITKPSFSLNSTNASLTTYNGTDVQINLTIIDDVAIDFYRLSTNDSVGFSWTNESLIDASDSVSVNASFDYTISNLLGGTFGWRVWANDTNGNVGQSNIYTFLVIDNSPPTYFNNNSSFQNNASTLTKINGVVNWSINLSDSVALSYYFFAHNNSGTLTNVSNGTLSGTSQFVNETITITQVRDNYICGQFWFNDSSDNINQTLLTESGACFTVADTLPTTPTGDSLNPNNPIITDTLTGTCSGSTDADSDTITYHYRFYDITDSNERQAFSSDNTYQLSSPEDLADTFRVDCRATTPLGNSEDRTGTDLETVRTSSIYEINTFSDGTSTGNMTFLSSIYKNISLPYWAIVTKAEIDLKGYRYIGYCYQETANVSTLCGGLSNGSYANNSDFGARGAELGYDGNLSTYAGTTNNALLYINYSKPLNLVSNNSFWTFWNSTAYENISVPNQCWDYDSSKLVLLVNIPDGSGNTDFYCFNTSSEWNHLLREASDERLYEEAMWWNITSGYPENVTIRTNNEITYQNLSVFDGTVTDIDLNITSFQNFINNNCNESHGNYCNITINFTSATVGILEYSNIEVEYDDFFLDNCSDGNITVLRITGRDEETDEDVNLTLNIHMYPSSDHKTEMNVTYELSGQTSYDFCSKVNTTDLRINAIMEYGDGTTYTDRKYYLNDFIIDTTTIANVYLYHLNNSKASEIVFTVFDTTTGDRVQGAFIKVLRYYPGENVYRIVEIAKTDETGQSLGKMVLADVFYKFIIEAPAGTVKLDTGVLRILSLTRSFGISFVEDVLDTWDKIHGVSTSVTCTKGTKTCRITWSDESNIVRDATLEVWSTTGLTDNLLSSQTTEAAAGTISYTIVEDTTGKNYIAKGFIESNTGTSLYGVGIAGLIFSDNPFFTDEAHRLASLFPLFLLVLVIIFALIDFGVVGVTIGALLGLLIGSITGMLPIDPFYLISFILMAIILIYKLSK